MSDHKFTVEDPDRVIAFSVTSEEAALAVQWLREMQGIVEAAIKDLAPQPPPIMSKLFGAFSAVADNRRYGGR